MTHCIQYSFINPQVYSITYLSRLSSQKVHHPSIKGNKTFSAVLKRQKISIKIDRPTFICYVRFQQLQLFIYSQPPSLSMQLSAKTSHQPSEMLQRVYSFANRNNNKEDTSFIDLLLTEDDSQPSHLQLKTPKKQLNKSTGLNKLKSLPDLCFHNNIPPVNHSPSIAQNEKCDQTKKKGFNMEGKKRLQLQYEKALQKLTQLRLHYDVRKHEKNQILSQKHL